MTAQTKQSKPGYLILYLGAEWWGSDARALAVALRAAGHCLIEVKYEDYFPMYWSTFLLRALRRLIRPWCAANYNEAVMQHLDNNAIDFVLVFKGMLLAPETLAAFRRKGTRLYCFYPDVGFATHGRNIADCLPLYDCVFTTKPYHMRDPALRERTRDMRLIRHGFDPDVHRDLSLSDVVRNRYACDVSFVGCWSPKKERLIEALTRELPACLINLWGPGWYKAAPPVRRHWRCRAAYGDELAIICQSSRINLGLLSEAASDTTSGDQTTVRSWQIPATGGFMLHEDTQEIRAFLDDGKEVALFDGAGQLIAQVRRFLADDGARRAIAAAGRRRVVAEQLTYDSAAGCICTYHEYPVVR